MNLKDAIVIGLDGMKERKFRVTLNIIGILIGISALTALISITQGMSVAINQQMELLGPTTIIVIPGGFGIMGAQGGGTLTLKDVDRIRSIPHVALVTPVIRKGAEIYIGGCTDYATVVGIIPEEYTRIIKSTEIAEGRFLQRSDRASTVLGANIAHPPYLDEPIAHIGSRLTIIIQSSEEEKKFTLRVAGILKKAGGAMIGSSDDYVFVTLRSAQQIFDTGNTVTEILVEAKDIDSVEEVTELIQDELGKDVTVISASFIKNTVGNILGILQAVLGGIAAISLIVAGISVINTMTISVIERTREIGIMKAVGAKNHQVLLMFLTEASLTGLVGGVVGAIFGVLLSYAASTMMVYMYSISLTPAPSLWIGIAGVVFATLTGMISGLYPAWKASKLDPVEALRYE